jgi:hypothetical protein
MAIAFAKLDSNNKVINVHIIPDDKAATEAKGEAYLRKLYWETDTVYKQTDTRTLAGTHQDGETPFRKNYASVGGTYDPVRDAFIAAKPFPSWILDEETCDYRPPVSHPEGDGDWNETEQKWD